MAAIITHKHSIYAMLPSPPNFQYYWSVFNRYPISIYDLWIKNYVLSWLCRKLCAGRISFPTKGQHCRVGRRNLAGGSLRFSSQSKRSIMSVCKIELQKRALLGAGWWHNPNWKWKELERDQRGLRAGSTQMSCVISDIHFTMLSFSFLVYNLGLILSPLTVWLWELNRAHWS